MIRNPKYQMLFMDYSSMYKGDYHPSDIDMSFLGVDQTLIIAEIKNEQGELKKGQKRILETIAEGYQRNAIILYITHDCYYQFGDRKVDVPNCFIHQIYYKGRGWRIPRKPTQVKEVLEYYGQGLEYV